MRMIKRFMLLAGLMLLFILALPLAAQEGDNQSRTAHAVMMDATGATIGEVVFEQFSEGVIVSVFVEGNLEPGFHGFHVHEMGLCEPNGEMPFSSAGGHFNPTGASHDDHAGDMPSLLVMADGSAFLSFITDRFDVADLLDADGSAVMIHDGADNFANIPERYFTAVDVPGPDEETLKAGDSGARVACGVVEEGMGLMSTGSEEIEMLGTMEPAEATAAPSGDTEATAVPTATSDPATVEPTLEPTDVATDEPTVEPTAEP